MQSTVPYARLRESKARFLASSECKKQIIKSQPRLHTPSPEATPLLRLRSGQVLERGIYIRGIIITRSEFVCQEVVEAGFRRQGLGVRGKNRRDYRISRLILNSLIKFIPSIHSGQPLRVEEGDSSVLKE